MCGNGGQIKIKKAVKYSKNYVKKPLTQWMYNDKKKAPRFLGVIFICSEMEYIPLG